MTDNRWPEIKPLLDRALDLDPDFRASFLDSACGDDLALKAEIEDYLALESETTDLETPLLDLIAGRSPEYRAGQRMGPYRLDAEIARGGMGVVYQASRIEGGFEQKVAIKILRRGFDTGDFVRRFRSERQILAGLDHPHIARLFDGGTTEDGLPYLVMEPVNGRRLDHYCQEEKLDLTARIELLRKICDAVHAAHQRLIVHCDLKPSNILVTADGTPKLLDFGIAKVLRQSPDDETRSLTVRLGTPGYSSPELIAGSNVTTGSDIYALGCLLHLLLTGEAPTPRTHADDPPPLPSRALQTQATKAERPEAKTQAQDLRQKVKGDLDAITLKALAWDSKDRYSSADALSTDLDRHLRKLPVSAQPYSWKYIAGRLVRRRKKELAVGLGVVLLVLLGLGQQVRAELQEGRAEGIRDALLGLIDVVDETREVSQAEAAKNLLGDLLENESFIDITDRAKIYRKLGPMFYRQEDYEGARHTLEKAVEALKKIDPPEPSVIASNLNDLAIVYVKQKHLEEGAAAYQQAMTYYQNAPGDWTANILDIQHNLAGLQEDLGDIQGAEQDYRRLLPRRRDAFGGRSIEVSKTLNQFAILLQNTGRLRESEALHREALAIRKELDLDEGHWPIKSLSNLASIFNESNQYEKAIEAYEEILRSRIDDYGPEDLRVARAQAGLAYALLGRQAPGDLERAETLAGTALETAKAKKPDSDAAAAIQRHLAAVLLARGKPQEAEILLLPLVKGDDPPFNQFPWRQQDLASLLGDALAAQGRIEEARPLLEGSWKAIEAVKGPNSRWSQEAAQRLAALPGATGTPN